MNEICSFCAAVTETLPWELNEDIRVCPDCSAELIDALYSGSLVF